MAQDAERAARTRLPDNPVHEMRSCQLAAKEIRARVGEDHYKNDFAWNILRDKWLLLRRDLIEFVSGSGVLVKNHKNPEWFAERESSPKTVNVLEKKRHVYQLDGRERVLMLDQLLDLEVLIGRQLVDIRRRLNKPVRISPEFALLRGLATAKAAGFTADLDRLKAGRIVHRHHGAAVIDLTDGLIDWLKSNGFDEVPTPDSYSSFAFLQSFRKKAKGEWVDCPVPVENAGEESETGEV